MTSQVYVWPWRLSYAEMSYTWSPFVPCLPWLARCGRWNFLQDTGWVHRPTQSSLFVCVSICILGVKSTLIQLCTQKSSSHNRLENVRRFPPEITPLFLLTPLYTTSLVLLAYSTAVIRHPIPSSAANSFSHLNLSLTPLTDHHQFLECTLVI
jgi:hypothetical protein